MPLDQTVACSKRYEDYPAAHRQHNHDGHCAYIHGHNWAFEFHFVAEKLDQNGFVIDFGKLAWLGSYLDDMFDHTLLLNEADPELKKYADMPEVRILPNVGCEGLAQFLLGEVNQILGDTYRGRKVSCRMVVVEEDSKNRASAFWLEN